MPPNQLGQVARLTLGFLPAAVAVPTAAAVVLRPVTSTLAIAATVAVVASAVLAAQCSRNMIAAPKAHAEHALFYVNAASALGALGACLSSTTLRPLVLDCYWAAVCLIVLPQILQSTWKSRGKNTAFGAAVQDRDMVRNAAIVGLSAAYLALRLHVACTELRGAETSGPNEQTPAAAGWHVDRHVRLAMDAVCPLTVRLTFPGLYAEAQTARVRRIHGRHWTAGAAVAATDWSAKLVLPYSIYRLLRAEPMGSDALE